ncbi:MAG: glyoxalase, partial [Bacteroidetes bacterium HGW-Bacteroidetes-22]
MKIDHIAIWTHQLEVLKHYYMSWFQAVAGPKYVNHLKQYESYFLSFEGETRVEIMQRPDIPVNANDPVVNQYTG